MGKNEVEKYEPRADEFKRMSAAIVEIPFLNLAVKSPSSSLRNSVKNSLTGPNLYSKTCCLDTARQPAPQGF